MSPDEYCQQKAIQSGSSFYYSFLFLPAAQRSAIIALYAFCREVDDAVDETHDLQVARTKINWWKQEVTALHQGNPNHPVTKALLPHLTSFNIEENLLKAIVLGMEMDLNQTRYIDFSGLKNYCWHVASTVGILSARIFGYTDPKTEQFAENLGIALQLTNIIRDVGEDYLKGRVYLPTDELKQFNVTVMDIANHNYSPQFESLMQFQVTRAQHFYQEAMSLLPQSDRHTQRPSLMMAKIYETLLKEIVRDRFHVLHQRIALTPIRKFWLAWKTYVCN